MFLHDPWFRAFVATLGWFQGLLAVGSHRFGSRLWFGVICLVLVEAPRIILPLGFVNQPRFDIDLTLPGVVLLIVSVYFATPVFRIVPLTKPNHKEPLRTDGLYSIIRHPLMLCDATWPLGWSLIYGSVIGVALTPVWFLICYLLTELEEQELVKQYGDQYREYQRRVPRLIPFVKWL